MKSALRIIVSACLLLALAHLTSAQPSSINCTSVRSLSSQCREEIDSQNPNANRFCGGNCFGPVLRAFQNCESEVADEVVMNIQEGEKSHAV